MKNRKKKIILICLAIFLLLIASAPAAGYLYMTHRAPGEYFDSAGVRIHYTDEGRGEPVILVHGFAVNADINWRRPGIAQRLAENYRVIALDLRGHGLSGKPHDGDLYGLQMSQDVIRLMDHLKIEKAHLVGYSLGGFIALKNAVDHPERFITVSPCGAGWETPDEGFFFSAVEKAAEDLREGRPVDPLVTAFGGERKEPGLVHKLWVRMLTRYFNDSLALAAMLERIDELALSESEVRKIKIPMLGIAGDNDPLAQGAKKLIGVAPNYRLFLISGADHVQTPMHDDMINALLKFLRDYS